MHIHKFFISGAFLRRKMEIYFALREDIRGALFISLLKLQDEIIFIFSKSKDEKCSTTFIYRIELPLQEREERGTKKRAKVQRGVNK